MNLLLHGSIYSNSAINRPLEQHYGQSTLSGYSPAVSRGVKLFVTAKGTPCRDYIITNFLAPDSNKAHNDYQHAPPNVANGGIQVWEAYVEFHCLILTHHFPHCNQSDNR